VRAGGKKEGPVLNRGLAESGKPLVGLVVGKVRGGDGVNVASVTGVKHWRRR